MSSNAGRAWQALFEVFKSQKHHAQAALAELDLTMQTAHALTAISHQGLTMRALADELSCDASNATGIVDRLETRGLIERRADPDDRRVKRVCLTAAGKRILEKVEARFLRPPPAIAALSAADQRTLLALLERVLAIAEAQRLEEGA
ncbi:MAG TPA: MarR family transcriptional regulator [Candidatus Elarobacter sp.]|jgi:DNA-binding MarR family transcriptional regulator